MRWVRLPRAASVLAILLIVASVALVLHSSSDAVLLSGANHWAHIFLPARVGVLINAASNAQDVADGADAWTSSTLTYGVVGSASGSDCDQSTNGRQGYVVVCVGVAGPTGSGTYTFVHSDCWYSTTNCDPTHIAGAIVYSSSLSPGTYVFCHELGHAIGQAHSGSGCMTAGASGPCPSSTDLAESEANYNHIDAYDSAAPFTSFIVAGNANCGGGPTPTPNSTTTPIPTPTSLPTLTPVPTSTPTFCERHPNVRKCQ